MYLYFSSARSLILFDGGDVIWSYVYKHNGKHTAIEMLFIDSLISHEKKIKDTKDN